MDKVDQLDQFRGLADEDKQQICPGILILLGIN